MGLFHQLFPSPAAGPAVRGGLSRRAGHQHPAPYLLWHPAAGAGSAVFPSSRPAASKACGGRAAGLSAAQLLAAHAGPCLARLPEPQLVQLPLQLFVHLHFAGAGGAGRQRPCRTSARRPPVRGCRGCHPAAGLCLVPWAGSRLGGGAHSVLPGGRCTAAGNAPAAGRGPACCPFPGGGADGQRLGCAGGLRAVSLHSAPAHRAMAGYRGAAQRPRPLRPDAAGRGRAEHALPAGLQRPEPLQQQLFPDRL